MGAQNGSAAVLAPMAAGSATGDWHSNVGSNGHGSGAGNPPSDLDRLKAANTALSVQQQLLSTWVTTVKMASGTLTIKALLQQVLEISQALVTAEQGSVFLINPDGSVGESLLARGSTIREHKREIVSQILGEGLAAWTIEHRQIGSIPDTMNDERWLTLPNQPYTVRSAICVPLVRGKRILGLITLMHGQPLHFDDACLYQMHLVAEGIALVLENAQIYAEQQLAAPSSAPPRRAPAPPPPTHPAPPRVAVAESNVLEPLSGDTMAETVAESVESAAQSPITDIQPPSSSTANSTAKSSSSSLASAVRPAASRNGTAAPEPDWLTTRPGEGDFAPQGLSNRPEDDRLSLDRCGVYITSAEGKLRYVNRRFAKLFGYRRRDISQLTSLLDLILPEYQDYLARQMERCMRDLERPLSCVVPGRHRDGRLLTLEIYAERIHFSGKPGTIGLVRLIGERAGDSQI